MHRRQSHWGAAICRSLNGDSPGAATSVSHLSTKRTTHARDARALSRPPEGGSTMFYTSHSSGFSEITGNQMHRGLCAPGFGHSAHAGIPSFQRFLSNGLGSSRFCNKGRCREGCQASATWQRRRVPPYRQDWATRLLFPSSSAAAQSKPPLPPGDQTPPTNAVFPG